jgi:hypothetical protein
MPETAEVVLCSKCKGPLDRVADNNWCKKCWATYQREYNATKEGRAEKKGFNQGREAMRQMVCDEFRKLPGSEWGSDAVIHYVGRMPGPQFEAD